MTAPTTRTVKISGLNEFMATCDWDVLVQPEMETARDTIVKRILRQGKGLGAKKNTLAATTRPFGATVVSTLNYPRTKGIAWGRKNEVVVPAMAPNVLRKMVRRIQERWSAS